MCARRLRLLVEPHELPKSVRCCVRPTRLVLDLGGARSVKGPMRVDIEKALEVGESEENVRVSGEAFRRVPFGIADMMSLVVCAWNGEA